MTDHPSPILPCPTPWKHCYTSPGEALASFTISRTESVTRAHRPYLCRCSYYHITSKPKREHS